MNRNQFCSHAVIALWAFSPFWGADSVAQSNPVPPCAGVPVPAAADAGDSLEQLVWIEEEIPDDWSPPACTAWPAGPTTVLLAAAGRFTMSGDTDLLVSRLARISAWTGIVYWSSTRSEWRRLFEEAVALSRPDRNARRADFSERDLAQGSEFYYWLKEDNPTTGIVYQLTVHERTRDRLVFEIINLTAVRASLLLLGIRIAAPEEFRQLYYVERETGQTWHYYSLVRLGRANSLAGTSEANYRNRAEAYFRYLARLKMDRDPPAAR